MTDRLNTIFGWLLGAGVVALLMRFAVGLIMPEAERPEELGYVIAVAEEGGAAQGPDLATLLAQGDAAAGEATFAKCTACHSIASGGADGIGPNLFGAFNGPIAGHSASFAYSDALKAVGGNWTFEQMDAWLSSPRAFANGTKMSFPGLSDPQERANVMLYLLANGGGPALPTPAPAAEPAEGEGEAVAEGEAVPAEGEAAAAEAAPAA